MKAMILTAGYGTRLGDLTKDMPKPMLPIEGKPMLEYIIRHLVACGFAEIALNLHFKPETIRSYFGDGSRLGASIVYSYEPELLGTAGGVKQMSHFLGKDNDFLVQYGDVVTDQNMKALIDFHHERKALATLLIHQRIRSNSIVVLDSTSRIVNFLERPTEDERRGIDSPWVNSGIAILNSEILTHIPDGASDLPRNVYSKLLDIGRLYGFPLTGYRCAVDSSERLEKLRTAISGGECIIDS